MQYPDVLHIVPLTLITLNLVKTQHPLKKIGKKIDKSLSLKHTHHTHTHTHTHTNIQKISLVVNH